MNPKTNGKTVFKFNTDEDFTTRYNNNFLYQQFKDGKIDIDYRLIDEQPYEFADNSWSTLHNQLSEIGAKEYPQKVKQVKRVFPSTNVDNPLKTPSLVQILANKLKFWKN